MKLLGMFKQYLKWIVESASNILVPEDLKIKKLLAIPPGTLREILPKSAVYSGDIYVLFDYQNKFVRLIVKSIKYKNNRSLKKRIAGYLYEDLIDLSSEIALFHGQPPILVPMPMSKKERRVRGFNQCEELAREIEKLAGPPAQSGQNLEVYYHTLKKIRETLRQTELNREERLENINNSLEADSKIVNGKVVIVLDDVYTTGASLIEARRALTLAGARRVIGLFIAH